MPLDWLYRTASTCEVECVSVMGRSLFATVPLAQPDGDIIRYQVEVRWQPECDSLYAREARHAFPVRLPSFCPSRHILPQGWFCLGWGASEPDMPVGMESATAWWALLRGYMTLQLWAHFSQEWRSDCEWTHGDPEIQQAVEKLEARIPRAVQNRQPKPTAACPCGSRHQYRRCHKMLVDDLDHLRAKLTESEDAQWADWTRQGHICCGTMAHCQLPSK